MPPSPKRKSNSPKKIRRKSPRKYGPRRRSAQKPVLPVKKYVTNTEHKFLNPEFIVEFEKSPVVVQKKRQSRKKYGPPHKFLVIPF